MLGRCHCLQDSRPAKILFTLRMLVISFFAAIPVPGVNREVFRTLSRVMRCWGFLTSSLATVCKTSLSSPWVSIHTSPRRSSCNCDPNHSEP